MPASHRARRAALPILVAGALATPNALAQDPLAVSGSVQWSCAYDGGEFHEVQCSARLIPSGIAGGFALRPLARDPYWEDVLGTERSAASGIVQTSVPRVVASRPQRDFRPVSLRGHDSIFVAGGWRVPLFARPSDMTRVAALLQDVLCGRTPDCAVQLAADGRLAAGH